MWVFQIKAVFLSLSQAFVICHKNGLQYNDFVQHQLFLIRRKHLKKYISLSLYALTLTSKHCRELMVYTF